MPFWWKRRRKPWWGYRFRYKRLYRRKRKPRRYKRRRYNRRSTVRRRRRRRRKVRRKRPFINIKQWQPDCIKKCKIKGQTAFIVGGQGKQMRCYTTTKTATVPPRTPYGGGIGYEVYTLKYLYSEHIFQHNIWTASNILTDLCRYLRCTFYFYRHPFIDFIVQYDRQPPFNINKFSYPSTHPLSLLLAKHKKLVLSKETKPNGKLITKLTIKPPKQMINKWFFTDSFYKYPLCAIRAAALDLKYSYLGCCTENTQLNIYYLNQEFYSNAGWGITTQNAYKPYTNCPSLFKAKKPKQKQITVTINSYDASIALNTGYFQPDLLQVTEWQDGDTSWTKPAEYPVQYCIYNPQLDSGEQNAIYLSSIHTTSYEQPTKDPSILIVGLPLWQGLLGYFDYINEIKQAKDFLKTHICILKSPALIPHPQPGWKTGVIPLDKSFIEGKSFFGQTPTYHDSKYWYPTCEHQQEILNAIVACGPYIPKLDNQKYSTWELKAGYSFSFKWGGPQNNEKEIQNPADLGHYDVPDKMPGTIQIQNPAKQQTESLLHAWDFRRGYIKERALKRMYDNQTTDTSFQAASEYQPPRKRYLPTLQALQNKEKKIKECLHSLCEESTCQETPKNLEQLIKQQQQQQLELKRNILQLLADMKTKQRMLQLQTGLME
nr:MAG: ORF1 [Torque teno midi virus]